MARSPVLQVVAIMGPESSPSFEDRLRNVEARLAALESSSRVSSSSSSRTSNPDAAGGHGAATPGIAYFTIREVAETTRLSESHIRRAIRRGDLPASNVGTPDHPIWRISLGDVLEWMDRKKGGTSKVPPQSSLRDVFERHQGCSGIDDSRLCPLDPLGNQFTA